MSGVPPRLRCQRAAIVACCGAMGRDRSVYVAAATEAAFLQLVGTDAFEPVFDPSCRFGRISAEDISERTRARRAQLLSRRGGEAVALAFDVNAGDFAFAAYRDGVLVRALELGDQWTVVRGEPEPWEAEFTPPVKGTFDPDFDIEGACQAISEHYGLSGWFEIGLPGASPPVDEIDPALLAAQAEVRRRATSLLELLRVPLVGAVPPALFTAQAPMFLLVEPDEAPHVRVLPGRRLLPVFVSRRDLDEYFAVWGPGLALRPGAPADGAGILTRAAALGITHLQLRWGATGTALLDTATLTWLGA